jgi:hypothetical protein
VLTVAGPIEVPRRYFACPSCGETAAPMDAWAGIGSRSVSDEVRRLVVLAGSTWSFDQASAKLKELCRLSVSNDTVRAVCDEEGQRVDRWLRQDEASVAKLQAAAGELEFSSDGTSVNTTEGWREMRLSVLGKREAGAAATPAQWDDRVLPRATARLAWSQIADCRRVGARWEAMFAHAGIADDAPVSVIADGAKWIWEQAATRLPGSSNAQWVVDVYHVSQHVHACGKAMFGEGTQRGREWSDRRLMELLEMGGPRFVERLDQIIGQQTSQQNRAALRLLRGYLHANRDRMWYRQRLAQGRAIGSGLIEGGCKNVLGARLKLNSARWRIQRAERMGHLRCLQYSDLWESYWQHRLN